MPEAIHPVDLVVGQRLAAFRLAKGLNQTQLGKALGVTFQQVQKYESARNRISASKLHMAASALDVRMEDFFPEPGAQTVESAPPTMTPAGRRLIAALAKLNQTEIGALADTAKALGAGR